MEIKVVDEVLVEGKVVDTDVFNYKILWGEEIPFYFARLEAVGPNELRLKIPDPYSGQAELAVGVRVPLTLLNGEKAVGVMDVPFTEGDVLVVHFVYKREFYITRQTVTLVSNPG